MERGSHNIKTILRRTNNGWVARDRHRRTDEMLQSIKSTGLDDFATYLPKDIVVTKNLEKQEESKILTLPRVQDGEIPKPRVFHPPREPQKSA